VYLHALHEQVCGRFIVCRLDHREDGSRRPDHGFLTYQQRSANFTLDRREITRAMNGHGDCQAKTWSSAGFYSRQFRESGLIGLP